MKVESIYDAIVIGAGPAGSVAAYRLSQAGWRVALIEQHRFPRDKVCGECLSALGITTLHHCGLADEIRALKPVTLRRAALHAANGATSVLDLEQPMWGISREALDTRLLKAAREAGAEVFQPARVEEVLREQSSGATVIARDLVGNERWKLAARWVLLADGKGALMARRERTTDFGIKAHFENVDADRQAIGLFGYSGSYGGVAPIEAGRWNLAFSVPADLLHRFRGRLDDLFTFIRQGNASLTHQFRRARRIGEWCASPLPRFGVAKRWLKGIIPLGNATAALEPIGGEGMGLGMRSAELAVECLLENPAHPDLESLGTEFRRLWMVRRWACRAAALTLSSQRFGGSVVELLAEHPWLATWMLRFMGKAPTGHLAAG